jgi:holo-[acyl-carrier protein] synthase
MMLVNGVDLIEIARVRRAAERWGTRFLQRVYTPVELADCGVEAGAPRYESLAARWAAKEAAAKALGLGLSGLAAGEVAEAPLRFHELEVVRGPAGRPELRLHGRAAAAAQALGLTHLALSLSHTHSHAVASVVGLAAAPR